MKIAIVGKMCSGKSTLANTIKIIDKQYTIYSIGGKVKEIACDLFNMKTKNRQLLIDIGMKLRDINNDVWINYIIDQTKNDNHCIIDDVRFQNEIDLLVENGFKIIQLKISKKNQIKRLQKCYPDNYNEHINNINHISENNELLNINPILTLNTCNESSEKINHELNLLLYKNK